jgi:hypothetical protein
MAVGAACSAAGTAAPPDGRDEFKPVPSCPNRAGASNEVLGFEFSTPSVSSSNARKCSISVFAAAAFAASISTCILCIWPAKSAIRSSMSWIIDMAIEMVCCRNNTERS